MGVFQFCFKEQEQVEQFVHDMGRCYGHSFFRMNFVMSADGLVCMVEGECDK